MQQFTTQDQYGRSVIKAPKSKFLKIYLVSESYNVTYHGIIDQWGLVFVKGFGGWSSVLQYNPNYKIKVLPNAIHSYGPKGWSHEDWWEKNWSIDSWAWIYIKSNKRNNHAS